MRRVLKIVLFLALVLGPLSIAKMTEHRPAGPATAEKPNLPGAARFAAQPPTGAAAPSAAPAPDRLSRREATPPGGLPVSLVDACEGAIDQIDGQPVASPIKIGRLVSLDGWMTLAGKDGTTPDDVFVTLSDHADGTAYFSSRRVSRPDLKAHFSQPNLRDAGFSAAIDTTGLAPRMTLGLARQTGGRIERCGNFAIALQRADAATSKP
ncbi:MAG TPA: hypothetical protein VMB84_09525 [Stellaceae bacterium]|nr:hypothetical protein [Stellaceae bacterium]